MLYRGGHYLYLAAEKDDLLLRRESVFLLLPDGSVLAQAGSGRNSHGAVAAGDRLRLECLEPFRRWRGRYAGPVFRLAGDEIITGPRPGREMVDAAVEVESAAPPWNTEGDWGEQPPSLRYHQFYAARGTVEVSGSRYPFAGPGFRSHSRRRRDVPGFAGHAIINGRFPSGRGFGLLRYRATADRPERGRGFLCIDGVLHDADVTAWPHLDQAVPGGERLTIGLRARGHQAVITAETIASTFVTPTPQGRTYGAHPGDGPGTVLSPAFARYEWDGETGYGGLERSALRVSGRGVVAGFTVNHQQWLADFPPPYVIAVVALEEDDGARLTTNIVGCPADEVRIGMAVRVLFEKAGDVYLPLFEPDPGRAGGPGVAHPG